MRHDRQHVPFTLYSVQEEHRLISRMSYVQCGCISAYLPYVNMMFSTCLCHNMTVTYYVTCICDLWGMDSRIGSYYH